MLKNEVVKEVIHNIFGSTAFQKLELIRTGAEKYSGLIADQKFTGRTEIRPVDREARGGPLHGFRTWCQPSDKLSVNTSRSCRHAWKQHLRTDMKKYEMSPYLQSKHVDRHVGARGAAAHATGAMRSDTRAATNLKGVHSGLGTPLRSVGTGGYLRSSRKGFGRGFGQGSKPQRTKHSRIAGTSVWYRALPIACLISNARLVFWVLRGKEGYRGCIKHALYGEFARKHVPSCDALSGLHVSHIGCSNPCALWLRVSHVALLDHGFGLDGQSCSWLIVGWPVGFSSPTLGVGRPSVMFLFDCWPVGRPMPRTVRGCYRRTLQSIDRRHLPSRPHLAMPWGL
ncbi:hypothetical protein DY000_02007219 [Brassica cretica]|uniref:Uncharacterized protein n=1 Tax=Brassica cretica TaxID=69181 RepID=A0ABQ7BVQ9_BRACR|nr:hypothetical protein DY000_02007219 [Brassica cretica]